MRFNTQFSNCRVRELPISLGDKPIVVSTFTLPNCQILREKNQTLYTKKPWCSLLNFGAGIIGAIPKSSRGLRGAKETWSCSWRLNLQNR